LLYFLISFSDCPLVFPLLSTDCGLALIILDENHNNNNKDTQEEASSPSKRTKNVEGAVSPSVMLHRMPLSPRKDLNLTSPVHVSEGSSSLPNTLPKTIALRSSARQASNSRTRRNLTSTFASLTADSSSHLQQRCNSVDDIGNRTRVNHAVEMDTKTNDILKSSTLSTVTSTTPSKPCKKIGTPSKVAAKLSATPTHISETASKHELAKMRLVKDNGAFLLILILLIFIDIRLLYIILLVICLLLIYLMDQCCFDCWSLSASATLPVGGPGTCAVRRLTLHSGPVWLHAVRVIPCLMYFCGVSQIHQLMKVIDYMTIFSDADTGICPICLVKLLATQKEARNVKYDNR